MQLFIKEEQKHGENLGRYLDMIGQPRIKHNWGDTLFRRARHFNTSMESWTLAVLTVENAAQVFYQSLKEATSCILLKQICREILTDEAYHIQFQRERMEQLFEAKSTLPGRIFSRLFYKSVLFRHHPRYLVLPTAGCSKRAGTPIPPTSARCVTSITKRCTGLPAPVPKPQWSHTHETYRKNAPADAYCSCSCCWLAACVAYAKHLICFPRMEHCARCNTAGHQPSG